MKRPKNTETYWKAVKPCSTEGLGMWSWIKHNSAILVPEISINCASSKILVHWVPESKEKNIPKGQNKRYRFLSCSALPLTIESVNPISSLEKAPLLSPVRGGCANPAQAHKLKRNSGLCPVAENSWCWNWLCTSQICFLRLQVRKAK